MFEKFLYLVYGYIRPLLKWLLHRFTRLCELQRICYGCPEGSVRTAGVERSLRLSRRPAIKALCYYMDQRMDELDMTAVELSSRLVHRAIRIIVDEKQVNHRIHPDFQPLMRGCIESIWAYQRLYTMIEHLRCTQYDANDRLHEERLYELWNRLMPNEPLEARITKQWQDIGFQGEDPKTDFRGMGMLGLENLLYFACELNDAARHVLSHSLHPQHGYTFAIVGINLTSMAYKLFKNGAAKTHFYNGGARSKVDGGGGALLPLEAFHKFYCYLFYEFDRYWMQCKPSSIMDFSYISLKFETNILQQLAEPKTHFRINMAVENV